MKASLRRLLSRLKQPRFQPPKVLRTGIFPAALGLGFGIGAVTVASAEGSGVDYAEVRKAIADTLDDLDYDDGSYGPVLVRLAWHASGTFSVFDQKGGSCGATMRFAPEASDPANAGLDVARDLLEPVKAQFPAISYSDLWTLAGCVAIEEMGGPKIQWRPGRADAKCKHCCPPNGRLPDASRNADHLRAIFYRMGMSDQEIVALSGAHVLGRCHTTRSGYDGPWVRSPTTFSNEYFRRLHDTKWTIRKWSGPLQYENPEKDLMMLPTDMELIRDPIFAPYSKAYANDEDLFFKDFAKAFQKLIEL